MRPGVPKIALFLPNLRGGGAERVMVTLANAFVARGLTVDMVLGKAEGEYLDEVSPSIRIVDLGVTRALASLPRLTRYLRQARPETLLATMSHTNVVAAGAKRLSRSPVRLVLREAIGPGSNAANADTIKDAWMPGLMRHLYPGANGIVAVSGAVADDLAAATGLARDRIRVIYNPVVTSELLQKAEEVPTDCWGQPGGSPLVLGVGRLAAQKGFYSLIQAFSRVRAGRPATLLILGEGPERTRLEALVQELGLERDVSMPGFKVNPYAYMRLASVFVLSSLWEGLPGALIQAMACGTPVVSTDCLGGPAEILENGKWGQLVPQHDVVKLEQAIVRALDDPAPPDVRLRAGCFGECSAVKAYLEALGLVHGNGD